MGNDLIAAVTVVGALIALVYGPWQWVCTDWARHACFEARDQIFDLALAGKLNFESTFYRDLRASIESEIRYAHELTLPYILWMGAGIYFRTPRLLGSALRRTEGRLEAIADEETRSAVAEILRRKDRSVFRFVVLKSPILALLPTLMVIPLFLCFAAVKGYVRLFVRLASVTIRLGAESADSGDHFGMGGAASA